MTLKKFLTIAIIATIASSAWPDATGITIKNAWVRAIVPGQDVAGAYMDITSARDASLVKLETPAAKTAEIHSMKMENGVMRMRSVDALPLPARKTVRLEPGGYHLMLTGLQHPLKPGDNVSIKLTVDQPGGQRALITVNALVRDSPP